MKKIIIILFFLFSVVVFAQTRVAIVGHTSTGEAKIIRTDFSGRLMADTTIITRVDTLNAEITAIRYAIDQLETYTDRLEALGDTTNAELTVIRYAIDQLEGYVDGLETNTNNTKLNIDTLRTLVDQLEGYLDNVETNQATQITRADTLVAEGTAVRYAVDGLETINTAIKTAVEIIDNAIAGNEMQVDVLTMPTTPVTGTFWQATQPVSVLTADTITTIGTFWQATQPVSGTVTANAGTGTFTVNGSGFTQPISASTNDTLTVIGSFYQATQPVSIATMPSTPVTGTFWQATQPISGTVGVNNFPATQPVSGTFWQTTQPVSIATMPSTPVTGTFYQATQPVSIASMPSTPVTLTSYTSGGYGNVSITTSADTLSGTSVPCAEVEITNNTSGETLYVGYNASVTSSNGFPLAYRDTYSVKISNLNKIYLIGSATIDVRYIYNNY